MVLTSLKATKLHAACSRKNPDFQSRSNHRSLTTTGSFLRLRNILSWENTAQPRTHSCLPHLVQKSAAILGMEAPAQAIVNVRQPSPQPRQALYEAVLPKHSVAHEAFVFHKFKSHCCFWYIVLPFLINQSEFHGMKASDSCWKMVMFLKKLCRIVKISTIKLQKDVFLMKTFPLYVQKTERFRETLSSSFLIAVSIFFRLLLHLCCS